VGISALLAMRKGLIRVVFSTVGIAAGLLLGSWYFLPGGLVVHRWVSSLPTAEILAFLTILFGCWFVSALLAGLVRKAAKMVGLGVVDRLLGGLFGAVRGLLLGVSVLAAMTAFDAGSGLAKNSVLAPYFLAGAHAVSLIVPEGLRERMQDGAKRLRNPSKRS
jgi:membrane protein required for colicin V production